MAKPFTFLTAGWLLGLLAVTSPASAIQHGTPATAFPEAIVLTANGFVPCSGVLLSPTVVLTAGHCSLGSTVAASFDVVAPNAPDAAGNPQTAHGSRDWSPYDDNAKTTSDMRVVFLDTPINIAKYPAIATAEVAAGTKVVDVGRTLNGTITQSDYVSGEVVISGDGTSLGFPLNYQALPDVSEDGDSGGPIELEDGTHTLVALVDTDTTEQSITETTPIDLFVRLDLVRDQILAQMSNADAGADGGVITTTTTTTTSTDGGGCTASTNSTAPNAWLSAFTLLLLLGSRRRSARRRG